MEFFGSMFSALETEPWWQVSDLQSQGDLARFLLRREGAASAAGLRIKCGEQLIYF